MSLLRFQNENHIKRNYVLQAGPTSSELVNVTRAFLRIYAAPRQSNTNLIEIMMMKPPFAVEIKLKLDRNDLSWGARVTEGARRES